ncbi:MAG: glycosyltransferase, partial [Acidimicrobiales bacterium]
MRILVVSAHYPPNFVSGGTLVPQRQARGLRAAGFDVRVYAGWLGDDRRPLDTFDTVDDSGLPVRWIVTTPWTAWSDPTNYDNAAVAADFERHLVEVAPDVVHFHSLQSLGAGLLAPAARSGARVVVTMHDFWWSCARQFLVDREFRPCSLVVSCGDCACEVDRPWLDSRNRFLAEQLVHADVVLAPSRSAAEVVVANGVPPAKVRVDENGVPAVVAPAPVPTAAAGGPVRFLYAGGHDRMKGAHVLVDAVRRLAGVPGWRLTAYGLAPFFDGGGPDVDGLPVDLPPPFDPAAVEEVFSAADVLVVPSVMRESHSILTREALTRGLPVVCAESIGPEEVVDHGRNGLVVPAADPTALAAALRRLACEPDLLAHLRNGCEAVPVRSVDDQVAGLGVVYRSLVGEVPAGGPSGAGGSAAEGPAGPECSRGPEPFEPATDAAARRRTVRRVVFLAGIEGAPLRYRARLPAEALGLLGVHTDVRHYRDPELPELCLRADAVVSYRVPATTQVLDLLAVCRERGTPVLCDLDDLIFDPDLAAEIPALSILPPGEAALWMEGVRRYRTTMEACDAFIGSTEGMCRHAEDVVGLPAERFANGVGIRLARAADATLARPRAPGPLRIGYLSGTDTHDHDWRSVEPVVVETLDAYPDVELWLGGTVTPTDALDNFETRVRRLPMLPWLELPDVLRDLDVNLAPLVPGSRFNEAKSAIKWLEAALTATVTLASATAPFREAIDQGRNGLLADGAEEWRDGLRRLLDDDLLRAALGRRARRDALLRWSPHAQGTRYLEILETAPRRPRTVRAPGSWAPAPEWEPVDNNEPFAPHNPAPHDPAPSAPPA